jgi:hypothetical protein
VRVAYTTKNRLPSISRRADEPLAHQRAVTARLTACGIPPTVIDHAIEVARSGDVDLLQRLIAGEIDVAQALTLARRRGRP